MILGPLKAGSGVTLEIQKAEFPLLEHSISQNIEPTSQGSEGLAPRDGLEWVVDVAHDHEFPVGFPAAINPDLGLFLNATGFVSAGFPALATEPMAEGVENFRMQTFGQNNSQAGAYHGPEGVVGPVEAQQAITMANLDSPAPQGDDEGFAIGAGSVSLVQELGGPDVVVASNEMDFRSGIANLVDGLQDFVISTQSKVWIVEPEVEDIPEKEKVIGFLGKFQQFTKTSNSLLLCSIGEKMKMRIGHKDGSGLFIVLHWVNLP